MTDREYRRQKKRLERLVRKWVRPIGLGWFRVRVNYWRDGIEAEREASGFVAVAQTRGHWEYLDFTIDWDMREVAGVDDDELEYMFVHELAHVLIAEAVDGEGGKHIERTATLVAKALIWAREAGQRSGGKGK